MINKEIDLKKYELTPISNEELQSIEGGSWLGNLMIGIGWVIVAAGAGATLIGGIAAALFVGGIAVNSSDDSEPTQ
jgi:bacteriocin-like protein